MSGGAVFIDRDGTIIRNTHYVGTPELVELLTGAGAAIRRLNQGGWPVVVITNQSGIARAYFTVADYERVRTRVDDLLAAESARIDASFMCPHHPDFTGPCECRKPGTLLFREAAAQLGLDLKRSWFIGDTLRDVLPAAVLGGRGILVPTAETSTTDRETARREFAVVASLDEAVTRVIESA